MHITKFSILEIFFSHHHFSLLLNTALNIRNWQKPGRSLSRKKAGRPTSQEKKKAYGPNNPTSRMNPASIARKLFGEHRGASSFFFIFIFLFLRYFLDFRQKLLYFTVYSFPDWTDYQPLFFRHGECLRCSLIMI